MNRLIFELFVVVLSAASAVIMAVGLHEPKIFAVLGAAGIGVSTVLIHLLNYSGYRLAIHLLLLGLIVACLHFLVDRRLTK